MDREEERPKLSCDKGFYCTVAVMLPQPRNDKTRIFIKVKKAKNW